MACGVVPLDNAIPVPGNDNLIPSGGDDASNVQQVEQPDQLLGGSYSAPAHLAGSTPEADLLSHLQTAPLDAPVFDNSGAPPAGPAPDALGPDLLGGGPNAGVDTVANMLDHGVDYVQLLGVSGDPAQDADLLDHLQHPHA